MKNLCVAFLYNVRHVYPDANDPRSQLETDFDDPETIENIVRHLQEAGYEVLPIEANEDAYLHLKENKSKIDIALNYSEGIYGADREAQVPAMLEMLQIPYTGSAPLTQALCLNKAKAKEILLAHGIKTAPFQLFEKGDEPLEPQITFPAIVKPVSQGSSAGIVDKSVVDNEAQMREQVKWSIQTFHQGALVEPFLPGREFSVPMLGNPPEILPIIEADHDHLPTKYRKIDSLEVKWEFEEEADNNHLICPAKMDPLLQKKVEDLCLQTWKALGLRDICRMDVRCDSQGEPHLIEVNSPAGMLPPEVSQTSYLPLAARKKGWEYQELIRRILETALKRLGKVS